VVTFVVLRMIDTFVAMVMRDELLVVVVVVVVVVLVVV